MKKILLAILCAGIALTTYANSVSVEVAARVAANFWNTYHPQEVKPVETMPSVSFEELRHMYVFVNGEEGFVIVAADDRVQPILGYSFDSPFPQRELHSELRYWLGGYEEQIRAACATLRPAHPRWTELLDSPVPPTPLTLTNVPALVQTRWDQGAPYNILCPYDEDYERNSVVGCVATAMAQIMKRWNHPQCGTGSHSYVHAKYGQLSVDYSNTTYHWDNMPTHIPAAAPDYVAHDIALLSYHCGVAVDMMYSPRSSGAYTICWDQMNACAVNAFRTFFEYDQSLHYLFRAYYDDSTWLAMIDADLAQGRPLYYDGSDDEGGHAFILDGSDLDTHYHFNWGWSGYGDGFYAMNNLAPGSGGAGGNATYTFNQDQGAIFGIVPVPEQLDTVEVWDTACTGMGTYDIYDYSLTVANLDTTIYYLDTVINLHLRKRARNLLNFLPNGGNGNDQQLLYCYKDSVTMPECEFTPSNPALGFRGWSENRRGNGQRYLENQVVKMIGNHTFYAIWRDTSLGIDLAADDNGLLLWPNPATEMVNLSFPHMQGDAQVLLIDMAGRTVRRQSFRLDDLQGRLQISLTGLPRGLYYLHLETDEGVYNQKIIKE